MRQEADPRIVLIRHGETEWSREGRHTGTTDVPLTAAGEKDAARLAPLLRGRRFGAVLASPLQRAHRTAESAGLAEIETEPRLAEWDYGPFEGRTTPEIAAELGEDWSIWQPARPGAPAPAESVEQVGERLDGVLERIRPVLEAGEDVALVAHGHSLRVLTARWLGLPPAGGALFALDAGSLSELGYEHDGHVIWSWNLRP